MNSLIKSDFVEASVLSWYKEAVDEIGSSAPMALMALRRLLPSLHELAEQSNCNIVRVATFLEDDKNLSTLPTITWYNNSSDLPFDISIEENIFILLPGKTSAIGTTTDLSLAKQSKNSIYYTFQPGREQLYLGTKEKTLPVINPKFSFFSNNYCYNLTEAIDSYEKANAANSTCYILRSAWANESRSYFHAKPEWIMRRSLESYLRDYLRAAIVRVEQMVDESKPVDITIRWEDSTRQVQIIEIKWLGASFSRLGNRSVKYTNSRAVDGLKQVVNYLSLLKQSEPTSLISGGLVVFDGRRKGVEHNKDVTPSHAHHYENKELDFESCKVECQKVLFTKRLFLKPS